MMSNNKSSKINKPANETKMGSMQSEQYTLPGNSPKNDTAKNPIGGYTIPGGNGEDAF